MAYLPGCYTLHNISAAVTLHHSTDAYASGRAHMTPTPPPPLPSPASPVRLLAWLCRVTATAGHSLPCLLLHTCDLRPFGSFVHFSPPPSIHTWTVVLTPAFHTARPTNAAFYYTTTTYPACCTDALNCDRPWLDLPTAPTATPPRTFNPARAVPAVATQVQYGRHHQRSVYGYCSASDGRDPVRILPRAFRVRTEHQPFPATVCTTPAIRWRVGTLQRGRATTTTGGTWPPPTGRTGPLPAAGDAGYLAYAATPPV